MTTPRRVLLIHSRVGGGHLSAARALAAELEATGLATTELVDIYVESSRFPVGYFPAAYALLARSHPLLWTLLYRSTERGPSVTPLLDLFLRRGVEKLLRETRPDVVVSVLPMVNRALAEATARHGLRLEVVLTDWYQIHPLWMAAGVQQYTAPTPEARLELIQHGVAPEAVDCVGIPIRRAFATPPDPTLRARVLGELELDPSRFTLLAMVGAEGSPGALRNVARLARLDIPAQLVVVCGRNQALRDQVARLPAHLPVRALGFVDTIPQLMSSADLVVTKAGGLTLAEAFCRETPVVVHDILPGQEAGNLTYGLRHHAVEYGSTPAELERIVTALHADPDRRARLAARAARLARPDAAAEIAARVLARAGALTPGESAAPV